MKLWLELCMDVVIELFKKKKRCAKITGCKSARKHVPAKQSTLRFKSKLITTFIQFI